MNFSEALKFLKQGKKIRRSDFIKGWYLHIGCSNLLNKDGKVDIDIYCNHDKDDCIGIPYKLAALEILADDWEVIDE